jgi:hypothetical protein
LSGSGGGVPVSSASAAKALSVARPDSRSGLLKLA